MGKVRCNLYLYLTILRVECSVTNHFLHSFGQHTAFVRPLHIIYHVVRDHDHTLNIPPRSPCRGALERILPPVQVPTSLH